MAPKNKVPAGEMTGPELRKLIRAHNILSKIVIPKGTDRQGLIKLIEGKNYKVDHVKKVIRPKQQRGKQITLKKAEELTKPKPVSEEVKKKRAEKKKEQEELKKKDIKIAKKEAVQEFKSKQKEAKKKNKKAEKLNEKKDLKIKSTSNNKKDMGETQFIKNQKKLQLQKQKETRRALLKQKVPVDKSTRRGKPVKKKEEELSTEEMKKKIKEIEGKVKKKEEALKKKSEKKEILKSEKKPVKKKGGDPINKLTGPEAEELADKIEKLMKYRTTPNRIYLSKTYTYNLKERKDLFKILLSGKYMGPKNITKDQYEKLTRTEGHFYTPLITGIKKEDNNQVYFKTTYENYMLLPQLYMTGKLFGETIPLWNMDKIVETIEDYLKGDIGTKKKEKKKLEVKDFNILLMGKNYNKEEFLKWVDKEGYKLSKGQLEKLNDLVVIYKLQSFRKYFNSNGVLVLVPTLKFNAYDRNEKINIGEVFSELAGERGGSILKLELKPKEKIELTPEKIKGYDMTRLKFTQDELPSLRKGFKENVEKLEPFVKEYEEIKKKTNRDKNEYTPYNFLSQRGSFGIRDLQVAKGKDWLTKIDKNWDNENKKYIETKLYAPQELREWFNKNNLTIQKFNLISENMDSTITSYENMEKKIKKKYDL